ncbi:MAG: YerC/YecD family TrpR-related protein [bacterium]
MSKWENKDTKELFKTITALNNTKQARIFLRDLLTEQEIIEFSNRWKAAKMLNAKISYIKISEATGLSSRTVARISKWLNSGMGGYKKMIAELHHGNSSFGKGLS